MMITVVGIYGICWLPLHVITIAGDVDNSIFKPSYMRIVWVAIHWLAMSSCAYNPFIYWWMNPKFREGYICMFQGLYSTLCSCCNAGKERKESTSSNRSRRLFSKFGNCSRNAMSSGTQMVELTGIFCEGGRKCDTVSLFESQKNDVRLDNKVDPVPERSSLAGATNTCTNCCGNKHQYLNLERETDILT